MFFLLVFVFTVSGRVRCGTAIIVADFRLFVSEIA
jgi:hypothetical protein